VPFFSAMWNYNRISDVATLAFSGMVTADEVCDAASRLRDDVGELPVRLVLDCRNAQLPLGSAWVLMVFVEDVAIADVVVIGASRSTVVCVESVCTAMKVPVAFHITMSAWRARERQVCTLKPPGLLADICVGF
jgi:hypothetical protein